MKHIQFKTISTIAGWLCAALTATWLFWPELLLSMWNVESSPAVALVGRRNAALFLGFAVILLLVRNEPASPCRRAISMGLSVACLALAILGIYELTTGHAGIGILLAAVTELLLALGFVSSARKAE